MAYLNMFERKGVRIGREEGRGEEKLHKLKELLEIKFGEIPNKILAKIQEASPEKLDEWFTATAKEDTLEEIFA